MTTQTVTILAGRADEARKALLKLKKKAKRYNTPFAASFGEVYQEERYLEGGSRTKKVKVDVIDVSIMGETPKVGDYEFLASIELTPAGNFVDTPPNVKIDPKYRTTDSRCEHCKKVRPRKHVFAVRNIETGEELQVGRTCLRDFLGTDDASRIIGNFKFWRLFNGSDGEEGFSSYGRAERMDSLESLLAKTNALIRIYGWASKGMANNDERIVATLTRLWATYGSDKYARMAREELHDEMKDSDEDLAQKVIAWVRASTDASDYMHNLRVAFSDDVLYGDRRTGLAISAVSAWYRAQERELKRTEVARANRDSKHQGDVKERLKGLKVTLESARSMGDNGWGPTELLKFKDEAGNVYGWFTGAGPHEDIGAILTIDGTVKRHTDFNGILETLLTRVTVKEIHEC